MNKGTNVSCSEILVEIKENWVSTGHLMRRQDNERLLRVKDWIPIAAKHNRRNRSGGWMSLGRL